MLTLAINLTLLEVIVLNIGAIVLGVTIYFYLQSRKTLQKTLEEQGLKMFKPEKRKRQEEPIKKEIVEPIEYHMHVRNARISPDFVNQPNDVKQRNIPTSHQEKLYTKKDNSPKEELADSLKETIAHQQKILSGILKQVEEIENEGKEELNNKNSELNEEIDRLESALSKKNNEIDEYKKRAAAAEKMADRIDQVYQEFEQLQSKMVGLERQASKANNLALELEETKQSYEQLYKDLTRKQEKLEEVVSENQQLRQQLETLEDKLAEANLQRQQLHKKVQFLQELNSDMQSITETNKKLQTELRRIGELESMLTIMSEERDFLLIHKKNDH
ncbi:MAG: hypothetical protein ACJ748_10195 [Flavisolibacter sp.]